ncbi:alpha/beta hydrolase family protein [Chthonomonas calidirosea]|uniref:alpha/beta hydrolase family protein n=1 Tax=Chthonomonas calidirosea TaxID=454171 RepID=UPI0006EC4413|nr:alpha/beta hydrolase [Chthonomonas calidirosea]CEK13203.1 Alpha/beta hydrolase family [Chthonomonas calidirosea]
MSLFYLLVGLLAIYPAFGAMQMPPTSPLVGNWEGQIALPNNQKLTIILHISADNTQQLVAKMDVPQQAAYGVSASRVALQGTNVEIDFDVIQAHFTGTLSSDNKQIVGHWQQSGADLPLTLNKTDKPTSITPKRPQEPKPPYPYEVHNVSIPNPNAPSVILAGTLTLPKGNGPFPAALLIAGSGPHDRDEDVFGHKIFLVLADYLTRHHIAVLRYDKRGVGQSTGNFKTATLQDFASDALAAVKFLMHQPGIDPKQVGLIGHSEGGIVAPLVASQMPNIAYVVLLAGPGIKGADLLALQEERIAQVQGLPLAEIHKMLEIDRQLYQIVLEEKDPQKAQTLMQNVLHKAQPKMQQQAMDQIIASLNTPWMRSFLAYDPAKALRQVHCPVLAVGGDKDLQVPAKEDLPLIQKALRQGGNRQVTTKVFPGLNHLFQPCQTGSPLEYAEIETTFDPKVLAYISHWIQQQLGLRSSP